MGHLYLSIDSSLLHKFIKQNKMKIKNDIPEIKNDLKKVLRRLISYFFQGLLYIGPIFAVFFIIYWMFTFIDGLLPMHILPVKIPGLGFLIIFLGLTIVGFLGNTIIAKPLFNYLKRIIEKVPLIKTIYDSVTDLLSAFVGDKKKFNMPVLVKMNKDSEVYKMGFLTKEDLTELGIEKRFVAVYLPHSYNFSGNMFVVPSDQVQRINLPSSDVMKFIVSGGVIDIDVLINKEEKSE